MEWKDILLLIGMFIGAYLVVYLIFHCFILTRILSLVTCAAIFWLTFNHDPAARIELRWTFILLSTLAWQFYCGSGAFRTVLTEFIDSWGFVYLQETGGFLMNTITAGIVMGLLYHFLAPDYLYFYYIIPGAITLLTIISFATGEPFGGD